MNARQQETTIMPEILLVILVIVTVSALSYLKIRRASNRRKALKARFDDQEKTFDAWASERFGPNEIHKASQLKPLSPFESSLSDEEHRIRIEILERLPQRWAEKTIDADMESRRRLSVHFVTWGKDIFGDSWSETCDRLCRLVSANRTSSIDKLSNGEIEILNNYLLAEALGAVKPGGDAEVDSERAAESTRWTQQKCQNCGAALLKGQCIYCSTSYTVN